MGPVNHALRSAQGRATPSQRYSTFLYAGPNLPLRVPAWRSRSSDVFPSRLAAGQFLKPDQIAAAASPPATSTGQR